MKKVLSGILAFVMVFGILAGCSQKWGIEQITTELKAIVEKDEPDAIFDV